MATIKIKDTKKSKSITNNLLEASKQEANSSRTQDSGESAPFAPSFGLGQNATQDVKDNISGEDEIYDVVLIPSSDFIEAGVPLRESREKIKIKVPAPEVGYNTAKVYVFTKCGVSNEFDFTYENVYEITPSPPPDYNENLDRDVESAYDDCTADTGITTLSVIQRATFDDIPQDTISQEELQDLIASAGSNGAGAGGINENAQANRPFIELIESTLVPQESSELRNGGDVFFRFDFSGFGRYRILGIIDDGKFGGAGQTIHQTVGSVTNPANNFVSDRFIIPLSINKDYKRLRILLELLGESENRTRAIFYDFKLVVDELLDSSSPFVLKEDDDSSDSNKETYYISPIVADMNKTRDLLGYRNEEFISVDALRNYERAFWIRESQNKQDLLFASRGRQSLSTLLGNFDRENNKFTLPESILLGDRSPQIPVLKDNRIQDVLDIVYDYYKPYNKEQLDTEKVYIPKILEITPEYNFYYKEYEEMIKDPEIPENILPNMYFLQLMDQYVKDEKYNLPDEKTFIYDDSFNKTLISKSTFIPPSISPLSLDKKEVRVSDLDPDIYDLVEVARPTNPVRTLGQHLGDDYYEYFIDNYANSPIKQMGQLLNRSKNIVIPYSFLDKLNEFSKKDELYPMHIDIKFDTNRAAEGGSGVNTFSNKMKNNYFGDSLFLRTVNRFIEKDNLQQSTFIKQEFQEENKIFQKSLRHIDFGNLLFSQDLSQPKDNFIFLGDYSSYKDLSNANSDSLLYKEDLVEELQEIVRQNLRTYKNILEGRKCYTEPVFFRIAKYRGIPSESTEIQNIWIPNDPEKKYLRYFDTQVKYDQEYTYRIYSYDIVLANQYSIGVPSSNPSIGIYCSVQNEAKILLVENIYSEFTARVKDRPPVFPEVSLYTYRQVDNKLLIMMNKSSSTYKEKEIIIQQSDSALFSEIRKSQMLKEDELIEFSGDDTIREYQIFRTTEAPRKYEDFSNSLYRKVSTAIYKENPNLLTDSVSYTDTLTPNTKYYYMFRSVDVHSQLSNPSVIYQVEIVNENGTIYPLIQVYDFPKDEEKQKTKSLKRFLMIQTNVLQNFMNINLDGSEQNYTELKNNDKIQIGLQEETVYGKKYKLRIVSKNTSKVYDMNFSFEKQINLLEK